MILLTACAIEGELPMPNVQQAEQGATTPDTEQTTRPTTEPTPTRDPSLPTPTPLPTVLPQPTIEPALLGPVAEQEALLSEIYARVSPAVVSIDVSADLDIELPEGHPLGPGAEFPISRGSGFLYDSQGHIITNNHVVADANVLQVTFADGSNTEAYLVGTDPGSDLAVIKVDRLAPDAAPLPLGNSEELAVGQMAIAIGNPFGLQNTLTVGVISGLGRSLIGPAGAGGNFSIPNIIQSDASINPGNSGGPLINTRGEVIGVNTAISSETGRFDGVGYAIPAQVVAQIVPTLIETGEYQHPWIGIGMISIDTLLAEEFDLSVNNGVLITAVVDGSPADEAGLRTGNNVQQYFGREVPVDSDIITAINGEQIQNSDELISYLQLDAQVGDTLALTVLRDGQEEQIPLTLAPRP
jgi:2-alkenal reductase